MADIPPMSALLHDLTTSLSSTLEATVNCNELIAPPEHGLSLLDTKNELLLSYLQHLVFLIILKIRNAKAESEQRPQDDTLISPVVEKLVELRLYLEKGARPLEEKLRFQIEKALRAADDAERSAKAAAEAVENASASSSGSDTGSNSGSDSESSSEDDKPQLQHRSIRPAFSNMRRSEKPTGMKDKSSAASSLPYRPSKHRSVLMPSERKEREAQRERSGGYKSRTIDEFVESDLLHNPVEMPSIGSNIVDRGRSMKTAQQRAEDDERREYEESHFVRLPKVGKKDQAKKNKAEARRAQMSFGGEEWRDLDMGVKRIEALTQKKGSSGVKGALDRSRKRKVDTIDGPRGSGSSGIAIGERYKKRLKTVDRHRGRTKSK